MNSRKGKKIQWYSLITLALAIILLFLAFNGVKWAQIITVFQRSRFGFIFFACLTMSISYFARGIRWHFLLKAEKTIHPVTVFWCTMIGYLGNNFMPARAGDLIRPLILGKNANLSKSFVLGTIVAERGIDMITVVLAGLGVLASMRSLPNWFSNAARVASVLGFAVMTFLLVVPRYEKLLLDALSKTQLLPILFRERTVSVLQQAFLGMRAFLHPVRAVFIAGLTVVIWLIDVCTLTLLGYALEIPIIFSAALLLLVSLALASAIPSTPGYVGVYQFVAVNILSLFGILQGDALAFIIGFQAMAYIVVVIWGFLGLWRLGGWNNLFLNRINDYYE